MRNAFQAALLLGTFFLVATAQDSVTITSDPRDLSRSISSLIDQIRQREKVSVTYEDPRYLNPADTEDVPTEASKGSELGLLNFFGARRLTSRQDLVKAEKLSQAPVPHCTRKSPLPLLPSGPGGVGGSTSRGTDA